MKRILFLFCAIMSLNVAHAIQRLGNLLRNPGVIQAARNSMQPARGIIIDAPVNSGGWW